MDKAESKAAKSSYGTNPVTTLIQWITRQETLNYQDLKDISQIVVALQTAFKIISDLLVTPLPLRSRIRISKGEQNLKEVANNLITESLLEFSCIFALISEMNEKPIFVSPTGMFIIYVVPLEGDVHELSLCPLGSVFSIYKKPNHQKGTLLISRKKLILRRGVELLLSSLVVYGAATVLLISNSPNKVLEFHLDNALGDFIMVCNKLRTPMEGQVYYTDEKCSPYWEKKICQIIYSRKVTKEQKYCHYSLNGSKCATVYTVITTGGLYALPAYTMSRDDSALLLFEANPFTHLIKAAGGLVTTGLYSPLELQPETIRDKVPMFAGSKQEMEYVVRILNFERNL